MNAGLSRFVKKVTRLLAVMAILSLGSAARAQETSPATTAGGVSAAELAKANNPLADMNALNLQDSWVPTISGAPGDHANTMNVRPVVVAGRQMIRATIPLATQSTSGGAYASGFGDINVFDAIKLTSEGAGTDVAVGPLLVLPTATSDALGQGKWQAGGAAVAIHPLQGGSVVGALVTYQTSFAGDSNRPGTSLLAAQPLATVSMGGGCYFRSTAVWVFDFKNDRALVPIGMGIGRAFKGLGGVVNAFTNPQFTV